jgi:hypothetical protein
MRMLGDGNLSPTYEGVSQDIFLFYSLHLFKSLTLYHHPRFVDRAGWDGLRRDSLDNVLFIECISCCIVHSCYWERWACYFHSTSYI